ncbi:hypothetical protein ACFYPA_29510 [Streptomyces sp. NPDC005775]|uniref:8-oxoguanine DNA glycosylase OGG fold protein n=1 Tax=Streptomyces sp. NPDC005775 TaxID=3364729 RepID=UPI0036D13F4F
MITLPEGTDLPDRDDVLGQAISFDRTRWIPLLPDPTWWPDELDECPKAGRWPRVDRRTVFNVARRTDTSPGRRHLLVAALVWGTGTKAQSVNRRGRIFKQSASEVIDARLSAALSVLRERGAAKAYFAFNNDQHIPHLGAAFFTKVIYFAGHETLTTPYRPVILDSVVSRALKAAKGVDASWPENGWSTDQYGQYLASIHDYALRTGVLPDQVEAALFSYGKQLP